MLSLADLRREPDRFTAALTAGDGTPFMARLLRADDESALGVFLEGLSAAVRRVYRPHPLTADHARVLCARLDVEDLLPFLAWVGPEVAAYFLVQPGTHAGDRQRHAGYGEPLVDDRCCTLAPCVTDAWQGCGLGRALMVHVVGCMRRLGRLRVVLWGGVRSDNPRALRFYRQAGFRHVGDFADAGVVNHDMVLDP